MTDKIKNYYELLDKNLKRETKRDKHYKKHHIEPNSMICCIGGSGSGKSNSLINYISRSSGEFYKI